MVFKKSKLRVIIFIIIILIADIIAYKSHVSFNTNKASDLQDYAINKPTVFESKIITKVIDGDTVVIEGGEHVRLLGIDADERTYPCYDEARLRLEKLTLNKTALLEKDTTNKDQYNRLLRYVFVGENNINALLVSEGLAVARFMGDNIKHKQEIVQLEKEAINNHTGCKWGK